MSAPSSGVLAGQAALAAWCNRRVPGAQDFVRHGSGRLASGLSQCASGSWVVGPPCLSSASAQANQVIGDLRTMAVGRG